MKTQMMHTRIDPNLKQQAEAVFSILGIDTADAIRMFFAQVALNQGLPFSVKIPERATHNLPNRETEMAINDSKAHKNLKHIPMEDFDRIFNV